MSAARWAGGAPRLAEAASWQAAPNPDEAGRTSAFSNWGPAVDFRHDFPGTLPGRQHWPGDLPVSRRGADNQLTVSDGFIDGRHHARSMDDIFCADCAKDRLTTRKLLGIDQNELGDAHVFHRPGSGANVTGV